MEYYAFVHFSTNTFTDQEWGYGAPEDIKLFNPTDLDCDQWARVCKQAGMKGIIITAKHHSGFCLWPTETTEYSIKNCPWKNGKGDIVGDLAKACKKYGLKLGIYISPWDRNNANYGMLDADGSAPYVKNIFRKQIEECLTKYGDIFEIWFDGANGGDGYYGGARTTRRIDRRTYYDWQNTYKLIRKLQPKIVIWNDNGDRADLRWVGTEAGYVGETNWSLLNATGDVPENMLRFGVENGDSWVPGEVNTSIRPGWFYHTYEDSRVKTLTKLMDTYYNSIGRNGTFLLNFPIDKRGRIHELDEKVSADLANTIKNAFSVNLASGKKATASNVRGKSAQFSAANALDGKKETYWATDDSVNTASLTIDFGKPTSFNNFLAQEYIALGQRVKAFTLEALVDGQWKEVVKQTTIGYKRILRFPTVKATQVRFSITDAKANPLISNVAIYNAPQILVAPDVLRNRAGEVTINAADKESVVYYTLDGTDPTKGSKQYTGPIATDGKLEVKAVAYDGTSNKSSPITHEKFDVVKKDWKMPGIENQRVNDVIDGNPATAWYQPQSNKMPVDLVIDLGKTENLVGFKYLPGQTRTTGIITNYQFYVSQDNEQWQLVNEGEFSNIKNNPMWQIKTFNEVKTRYIKLRALKNTQNNDAVGYAEVDVITK
ncbi:MAG: alpha-L-fucosidase [Williamsia sp.]|nr:alpha-L-fucosidase [Williamsia sp.]